MASTYRTRFAPSPTGPMHAGHARTALVTWLQARRHGGQIVMRFEDIDRPLVVPGAAVEVIAGRTANQLVVAGTTEDGDTK